MPNPQISSFGVCQIGPHALQIATNILKKKKTEKGETKDKIIGKTDIADPPDGCLRL